MKKQYETPRSTAIELDQAICLNAVSNPADNTPGGSRRERQNLNDDDWDEEDNW